MIIRSLYLRENSLVSVFSWKASENSSMSFNMQIFPLIKFSGYLGLWVMAMTMLKRYLIVNVEFRSKISCIITQTCWEWPGIQWNWTRRLHSPPDLLRSGCRWTLELNICIDVARQPRGPGKHDAVQDREVDKDDEAPYFPISVENEREVIFSYQIIMLVILSTYTIQIFLEVRYYLLNIIL